MSDLTAKMQAFITAVDRRDFDASDAALTEIGRSIPEELLVTAAMIHMYFGRWRDSVRVLNRVPNRDAAIELQRSFARNMEAMQKYRPQVYDVLMEANRGLLRNETTNPYKILPFENELTVKYTFKSGAEMLMCGNVPPSVNATQLLEHLNAKNLYTPNNAVAACGIGDGYLIQVLATSPPKSTILGEVPAVYVVDPDPLAVLSAMMIRDYTAPSSPIRQERFKWFIGPDWEDRMFDGIMEDCHLPFPSVYIRQGKEGPELESATQALGKRLCESDLALYESLKERYKAIPHEQWTDVFSTNPSRKPRLLVLSSRFTTVLQYSAKMISDAFAAKDWDTQFVIEPTDYHRMPMYAIHKLLDEYEPDLIFLLDHLRQGVAGMFPDELPVLTWIQDNMGHLTKIEVGKALTNRDFVLGSWIINYVQEYAYPARQCIAIPRIIEIPEQHPYVEDEAELDVVYVSNHSDEPEVRIADLLDQYRRSDLYPLIDAAIDRLTAIYDSGQAVTNVGVKRIIFECETAISFPLSLEKRATLTLMLNERLNNLYYRQQVLHWVAEIARERGLRFGIYGKGWDKNPNFHEFAKGFVKYGEDLERVTRTSRVNLMIEPYKWFGHQRFLEGVAAGGFFMVRSVIQPPEQKVWYDYRKDVLLSSSDIEGDVARFTEENDVFASHFAYQFNNNKMALINDGRGFVESFQHDLDIDTRLPHLPREDEISFESKAEFTEKLLGLLEDRDRRVDILESLRAFVLERFSCEGNVPYIVNHIHNAFETEPAATV